MPTRDYLKKLAFKAKPLSKTIVLPEGEDLRILEAAHLIHQERAANLVILGNPDAIRAQFAKYFWDVSGITLIDPKDSPKLDAYAALLYDIRKDKGMTLEEAKNLVLDATYFGVMMVKAGDADGMVSGANHSTADTVRPALQIIKSARRDRGVSSFHIMELDGRELFFSDCGLVIDPTDRELAGIAIETALSAIKLGLQPKVAMLSFSTLGSGKGDSVDKVKSATRIAKEMLLTDEYKNLNILLDGELQADTAIDAVVAAKKAPGSPVAGQANVLIFPNIDAGNIGYKLVQRLAGARAYGPLLQGLNAPINDLSRGSLVADIVGAILLTALQAGTQKKHS